MGTTAIIIGVIVVGWLALRLARSLFPQLSWEYRAGREKAQEHLRIAEIEKRKQNEQIEADRPSGADDLASRLRRDTH